MRKPASLRAAIELLQPELVRDAERFMVFIDNGSIVSTGAEGRSFEWRYTLNLIVTDYADDPNLLWLALLDWARMNQPELLTAPSKAEQIRFDVDVLATDKVDLDIKLPLTERVLVATDDAGQRTITPVDEPEPTWMS